MTQNLNPVALEAATKEDMRRAQAVPASDDRLELMANHPARVMQSAAPVNLKSGELRSMAEEILSYRRCAALPVEAPQQATNCAVCGQHKHTPLCRDDMGGYVCLTCIESALTSLQADLATAIEANKALMAERDAVRVEVDNLTAWFDGLTPNEMHDSFTRLRALASSETERADRAWNDAIEAAAKVIDEGFDRHGVRTKNDKCTHDRYGWEDCEQCASEAIRTLTKETSNAVD